MSCAKDRKRKRSSNTSDEQYGIYLNYMETDYILRSGTVNPSLPDNYINKKWEELCDKLNSIGKGPKLTIEEWQKRFNDWKNATRSKYRKITQTRMGTGGGPENKTKMTDIEERGLAVWGKVVVTGSLLVPVTGGLSKNSIAAEFHSEPEPAMNISSTRVPEASTSTYLSSEVCEGISAPGLDVLQIDANENVEIVYVNELHEDVHEANNINVDKPQQIKTTPKSANKRKNMTHGSKRSINDISNSLLISYQNAQNINTNLVTVIENYTRYNTEIENKKLDIENYSSKLPNINTKIRTFRSNNKT